MGGNNCLQILTAITLIKKLQMKKLFDSQKFAAGKIDLSSEIYQIMGIY